MHVVVLLEGKGSIPMHGLNIGSLKPTHMLKTNLIDHVYISFSKDVSLYRVR